MAITGTGCVVYGFVVLYLRAPDGSTGSGSDSKAFQRTEPRLKVSSDRLVTIEEHGAYFWSVFKSVSIQQDNSIENDPSPDLTMQSATNSNDKLESYKCLHIILFVICECLSY